ncbi:hypothetical protein GCM10009839_21790 [Catenulispora yoronensis]|uniref:WW domain-containing protein n=1 Tax=Catenulispora yoronensis TaxID=450799 RepID=A0ABP5FCG7_9ACTN
MAEQFPGTVVGYDFPTADWLDPFDVDEAATQWFFVNQDRLSRSWTAPTGPDQGWGFADDEPVWETFTNPRSCLYWLEKQAVVADGQVLREWSPTGLVRERNPSGCEQHNGLYFVHSQPDRAFPIHEGPKFASYDDALAEALGRSGPRARILVAQMVDARSLW